MNRLIPLILAAALLLFMACSPATERSAETTPVVTSESVDNDAAPAWLPTGDPARSDDGTELIATTGAPIGLGRDDASASFDFQAKELYSGSIIEGSELFGQGHVIVTFVQPGCEITTDGGQTIAEVAEEHPEAIFVIVHSGGNDDAYRAFAEEAMLFQENMVHLSDTPGSISGRYSIDAYPTTLLIDADLRVTAITGAMDADTQREAVVAATTRSLAPASDGQA